MNKGILFSCFLALALAGLILAGQQPVAKSGAVPAKSNAVNAEKVVVKPGGSVAVKVMLANGDTLAGLQVPIFYRSEKIKLVCDSVSFTGSLTEKFMFHDVKIPMTCIKCDSMYINPTKVPGICDKPGCGGKLYQKDQAVYFAVINNIDPKADVAPLYPGNGLIAIIYFTAPKDSPVGIVKLTRGMIPHPTISYTFSLWNPLGTEVASNFNDGAIEVK